MITLLAQKDTSGLLAARTNDLPIKSVPDAASAHAVIYHIQIIIGVSSYAGLLGGEGNELSCYSRIDLIACGH